MSVAFSSLAQIFLKLGVKDFSRTADTGILQWLADIAFGTPYVFIGLVMFGLSLILWVMVLNALPLSVAYPFVGIGFIFTMIAGFFFFGEALTSQKIAGTLLVASGVYLVGHAG